MNRIRNIISLFAFALLALGLPAVASAQWGGNNGPYNPNGGYGNGGYNRNIRSTVENLREGARNFERMVDNGNNDRYGRNNNRGNLKDLANDFTDATKDLRNQYGNGRDMNKSSDEARRVLDLASRIDQELGYSNSRNGNGRGGYGGGYGNYGLQAEWQRMRYDLQVIADAYGYNGGYNNRYPNGRNNRNGGDWRNRIPFPLPF